MADFHSNIASQFSAALSGTPPPAAQVAAAAPAPEPAPAATVTEAPPTATPAAEPPPAAAPLADAPAAEPKAEATPEPEIGEEEEFKFPDEKEPEKALTTEAKPEEDDPFDGKPPSAVEQAAVTKWLKTPKGRASLQGFKTGRELSKDLGFIPDATQIKQSFAEAQRYQAAVQDFHSAQPDSAKRWVTNWLAPVGEKPSDGAMQIAAQFIPTLIENYEKSPAARALYEAVAAPAVGQYINELYGYAQSLQSKEERLQWFNVARFAEAHFRGGEFREIPPELVETGKDPRTPDPRVAEIDQMRSTLQTMQQQQVQQAELQFSAAVKSAIETPLLSDIDIALAPIREHETEKVYNAIAKDFHAEVVKATRANPGNLRAYFEARSTAKQNPTKENIAKAGKAWADCARPAIRSLRPSYINDALKNKVSESAQRHQTLDEASQKRGAPSVAAPVEKSLTNGSIKPQPGENYRDAFKRAASGLMQNVS